MTPKGDFYHCWKTFSTERRGKRFKIRWTLFKLFREQNVRRRSEMEYMKMQLRETQRRSSGYVHGSCCHGRHSTRGDETSEWMHVFLYQTSFFQQMSLFTELEVCEHPRNIPPMLCLIFFLPAFLSSSVLRISQASNLQRGREWMEGENMDFTWMSSEEANQTTLICSLEERKEKPHFKIKLIRTERDWEEDRNWVGKMEVIQQSHAKHSL